MASTSNTDSENALELTDAEIGLIHIKWLDAHPKQHLSALLRLIADAATAKEKARCSQNCRNIAAAYGGVVAGTMATEYGKLVHQSMAAGALNCACAIDGDEQL